MVIVRGLTSGVSILIYSAGVRSCELPLDVMPPVCHMTIRSVSVTCFWMHPLPVLLFAT